MEISCQNITDFNRSNHCDSLTGALFCSTSQTAFVSFAENIFLYLKIKHETIVDIY